MKRINGRHARSYVQSLKPFKNSNGQLYADWIDSERYVVYSYGSHWPLFVYHISRNTWFENSDRYGVTTSKHRTFTHPHTDTVLLNLESIKKIAEL